MTDRQTESIMAFFGPLLDLFVERVADRVKEMSTAREPRYYTRKEACKVLGVTLPTLHAYTKRGDIQAMKINGRVLFDAWAIDDAVRTHSLYKGRRKEVRND